MILKKSNYTRNSFNKVVEDKNNLYLFEDSLDRTSGDIKVPDDSEYSKRFGKTGLKRTKVSSASIRGAENSCPLTTIKHKAKICYWSDKDFGEFKKVIDEDFEFIKNKCREKKYDAIIFPYNGLIGRINLNFRRNPKICEYILRKELELKNFEPSTTTP